MITIPYVYMYRQLKPKPRSVKQIEVDSNLRAKEKSKIGGKAGEARAGKK